jgi:hypothetical protein
VSLWTLTLRRLQAGSKHRRRSDSLGGSFVRRRCFWRSVCEEIKEGVRTAGVSLGSCPCSAPVVVDDAGAVCGRAGARAKNRESFAGDRRGALPPGQFQTGTGSGAGSVRAPVTKGGWLPAASVSGDHHSPGASDCGPQTVTGSEPAGTLEAHASQVASGTIDNHSWSLWSKHGQSGANGLETGGIVFDGTAHGRCPGFPNPAEMELLDPSGGGHGLAYGVVGYPGAAKIDIYRGTVETLGGERLRRPVSLRCQP